MGSIAGEGRSVKACTIAVGTLVLVSFCSLNARGQAFGKADRGEPGDEMIQAYLASQAKTLDTAFQEGVDSAEAWQRTRPRLHREYLEMLGLWPMPERTPLEAKVTGTIEGDGYVVEKLHYQSVPGLYVTGNLYRPAMVDAGSRLPAIFYPCGHSGVGRNGNKVAFQSHGIWFARHGYVCLVVDTLQLGEIPGIHHGTYRENRWWWLARGYTPAGVECWNGVRGIDYLTSRPEVDPERIGVTGISGGGAATFWIAAADERVKVAAPVSGMADLESYVGNRTVNGHCDCMFLHNAHRWPWTRIAALIAPRPMLFVNSDNDPIFPMDANERISARLERLYSLFGAGDQFDAVVSVGGHDYRGDIRKAVYRFMNTHLKSDARSIEDSEVDLVTGERGREVYPIEPTRLRVFVTDEDIPSGNLNGSIDRTFVPIAAVRAPATEGFSEWKGSLEKALREKVFMSWPGRVEPARVVREMNGVVEIETDPGIVVPVRKLSPASATTNVNRVLLVVSGASASAEEVLRQLSGAALPSNSYFALEPRGIGGTRWTAKNPPNYVLRSHVLLGQTLDSGRVRDIAATARWLAARERLPVVVVGSGSVGVLGAFAAILEPEIAGVIALEPPSSFMDDGAPVLLNALRVMDVPEVLGLVAPRRLAIRGGSETGRKKVVDYYQAAGAAELLDVQ
jgi:dienelactone hydrolase